MQRYLQNPPVSDRTRFAAALFSDVEHSRMTAAPVHWTCMNVLSSDVTLHDGETIGFSKRDKHAITRSKGVALPGMTIKIAY